MDAGEAVGTRHPLLSRPMIWISILLVFGALTSIGVNLTSESPELRLGAGLTIGGRNDGVDIAYPTAMLVDAGGVVRWIFQSESYRERARAEEIFAAIAALRRAG